MIRFSVFATNIALLGVVGFFAFQSHSAGAPNASLSAGTLAGSTQQANPLDKLSSADVAVHVARLTALPEATAVSNEADSVNAGLSVAAADDRVIAKPQIVATELKSKKDIKKYVAVEGDTISTLAAKFGITSETIRLSNGLTEEHIPAGKELIISPVNGIIYTVKAGDTPESIGNTYQVNKDHLIAFNDAELSGGFKLGEQIVVPNAVQPTAPANNFARGNYVPVTLSGYSPLSNTGNGYARGYCTWGVANLIPVPNSWGNAYSWAAGARASGWKVSRTPTVGAIAQTSSNHVGIVTAVSADGSMIKYKDMNGLAGFGRYGETPDFVPTYSRYENFITR